MSKISKAVSSINEENSLRRDETVTNFMGGDSYVLNPLTTMKMITASSIFGEPSYYRDSKLGGKRTLYKVNSLVESILPDELVDNATTEDIMIRAIDAALDYDFGKTLEWAHILRTDYNIRLNPQIIMVRAAIHPKRKEFTSKNPGAFKLINSYVMNRPDEPMVQIAAYMYFNNGSKSNIPTILKKSWATTLNGLGAYNIAKYKNHEIGMINAVRICHAHNPFIDELMKTGTIKVEEESKTWENLRSEGMSWKDICSKINIGHMAMLRNLRGIFTEVDDLEFCKEYLSKLKNGVKTGKQLPFRYYSALKAIENSKDCHHKPVIIDALEECMDIAMDNYPTLKGKTVCLSDNSGSAWTCCTSEYGTVTIAEIDNLSSVMTAANSDEGYVIKFGDTTKEFPISKRKGILNQASIISSEKTNDVGGYTEGGIWEFFNKAITNKIYYDNIFIYSDQQAGHGGLYGTNTQAKQYSLEYGVNSDDYYGSKYINVFKLIKDYRKYVNPKVNVFSVQTAGYDNNVLPEYAYRTAILYGWTGREAEFAKTIIDIWDEAENKKLPQQ